MRTDIGVSARTTVAVVLVTVALAACAAPTGPPTATPSTASTPASGSASTIESPSPSTDQEATSIVVEDDSQLAEALATARADDVVRVAPGRYGEVAVAGGTVTVGEATASRAAPLTAPATVTSQDPSEPAVVDGIQIVDSPSWIVRGLVVRATPSRPAVLVASDDVVVADLDVSSGDASSWEASDWRERVGDGIVVDDGDRVRVEGNRIRTVSMGIVVSRRSPDVVVRGNVIDGFAADGVRAQGDHGLYEDNLIANPVKVDDNHDDAIQSFADLDTGRPVTGNVLRHNTIVSSTRDDPLGGSLQGIGMFDGPYVDWTIENNLVVTDHYHGISVYGSRDTTIARNVALDLVEGTPGPTWVRFFDAKDGSATENGRLVDNVANDVVATPDGGVLASGNIDVDLADHDEFLVDHPDLGYQLRPGALPFDVGVRTSSSP